MTPRSGFLPAWLLQTVGLFLLVASGAHWAITGQESPLFVSAALALIGVGAYSQAVSNMSGRPPKGDK